MYYENLAKRLNNPLLQAETYWSILKIFYNNKEIPLIPPLLVDDKHVTDIKTKANIFNEYFAQQCTLLKNSSVLPIGRSRTAATSKVELLVIIVIGFQPLTIITKSSTLDVAAVLDPPLLPINQTFLTQSRLTSPDFNEEEILKVIRSLNIRKAHGHDDISIRIIKICDKSLLKPLIILFQNSVKSSYFPDIWKRSNIIPEHKKNDKQFVKATDQYLSCPSLEKFLRK